MKGASHGRRHPRFAADNAFQEHWGTDISQHGVLGGIGHGTADTFDNTRHSLAHMGDGIWHGITSVF